LRDLNPRPPYSLCASAHLTRKEGHIRLDRVQALFQNLSAGRSSSFDENRAVKASCLTGKSADSRHFSIKGTFALVDAIAINTLKISMNIPRAFRSELA